MDKQNPKLEEEEWKVQLEWIRTVLIEQFQNIDHINPIIWDITDPSLGDFTPIPDEIYTHPIIAASIRELSLIKHAFQRAMQTIEEIEWENAKIREIILAIQVILPLPPKIGDTKEYPYFPYRDLKYILKIVLHDLYHTILKEHSPKNEIAESSLDQVVPDIDDKKNQKHLVPWDADEIISKKLENQPKRSWLKQRLEKDKNYLLSALAIAIMSVSTGILTALFNRIVCGCNK